MPEIPRKPWPQKTRGPMEAQSLCECRAGEPGPSTSVGSPAAVPPATPGQLPGPPQARPGGKGAPGQSPFLSSLSQQFRQAGVIRLTQSPGTGKEKGKGNGGWFSASQIDRRRPWSSDLQRRVLPQTAARRAGTDAVRRGGGEGCLGPGRCCRTPPTRRELPAGSKAAGGATRAPRTGPRSPGPASVFSPAPRRDPPPRTSRARVLLAPLAPARLLRGRAPGG